MILNLTQHLATPDQVAAGVMDLPSGLRAKLTDLLTFTELPTLEDVFGRAEKIGQLAEDFFRGPLGRLEEALVGTSPADGRSMLGAAMIGGAGFLIPRLEIELVGRGIEPLHAFSVRESVESVQPDGSVRKVNVFRHGGFVRCGEQE